MTYCQIDRYHISTEFGAEQTMAADANRSQEPRILIYSQDGLGLGHMRRTGLIAEKLLEFFPDAAVLTLSDSPLKHFFKLPPKHRYLKLPTIVKTAPGVWCPADPQLVLSDVLLMRQKLIGNAFATFRPQLVLVDHMPHGAMGELLPHLQRIKNNGREIHVVLGLRDILDRPEVICKRWKEEGAYDAVQEYYDLILVYGQRELYNVSESYRFPLRAKNMVRYCGYICNGEHAYKTAPRIRSSFLDGTGVDTKLLVALAGGGADGYPMMHTLLEALPSVLNRLSVVVVIITGPFHPFDLYQRLKKQARQLPVHVLKSVDDACGYIRAADVVIAMAGYNTTAEVLSSGNPAILIPRIGPSAEQRTRSQLFMHQNWVEMIEPVRLSKARLADAVIGTLIQKEKKTIEKQPDLNGLSTAVNYLRASITELLS
jgi:predicted glycosyltransferase